MSECSQPESTNESVDPSGDSSENNDGEEWHYGKKKKTRDPPSTKKVPRKPRSTSFRCSKCSYTTKYNSVLKKHIRKHHLKQIRSSLRTQKARGRSGTNKSTSSLNNNSLKNGTRKVFVCKICEKFSSYDLSEIKCHVYNDHLHKRENEIYAAKFDLHNNDNNDDDEDEVNESLSNDVPVANSQESKGRKRKLSEINKETVSCKRSRLSREKSLEREPKSQERDHNIISIHRNSSVCTPEENISLNEGNDYKSPELIQFSSTSNRGEKLECTDCPFSSYDRLSFDRHNEEIHNLKLPVLRLVKKEPVSERSFSVETPVESTKSNDDDNGSEFGATTKNLKSKEDKWTDQWKSVSSFCKICISKLNFLIFRLVVGNLKLSGYIESKMTKPCRRSKF